MAVRKKQPRTPRDDIEATSPAQQDEADILQEIGAETDPETGNTVVDEESVLELGALDAASVIENRRNASIVGKKRANVKNVSFNTGEALSTYDLALKQWPPNTIDILVKRLTGVPVQHTITSRPRSGIELYNAVKILHGSYDEAEYEIRLIDTVGKTYRATTRMWMPDTRPQQAQQGQQQMPYQQQPPPAYPPQGYSPPAPAAPAIPLSPSGAPDLHSVVSVFQQMLEMTRQVHPQAAPGPQQPDMQTMLLAFKHALEGGATPAPQAPAPQPSQPSAPPGMVWVPQFNVFVPVEAMVKLINPQPEPAPPPPPPVAAPVIESPPGHIWVPALNAFVPIRTLARAMDPEPPPRPEPRPYRPPPDQYPPAYGERSLRPPPYGGYQQPQQRQQTPTDQLKEAMGTLKSAMGIVQEFSSIVPGRDNGGYEEPSPAERGIVAAGDDDSPVRIIDTGHGKIATGRDGKFRLSESIFANFDGILKFVGEQGEAIQRRAQQNRQPPQQPQRQLPRGYVEVGPNYQPPPGYEAVQVNENDLPPAPDPLPPPVSAPRSWGMPAIPED